MVVVVVSGGEPGLTELLVFGELAGVFLWGFWGLGHYLEFKFISQVMEKFRQTIFY